MAKKTSIIKATVEPETKQKLERLARETCGNERGFLVRFFEKLSREQIVFLDSNVQALLGSLKLQPKKA